MTFGERWRDFLGQLEVLRTYYARLSERERYIVLGSAAAGIVFLMLLIYSILAASTASMSSKIEQARFSLKRMNDLRYVYAQTERQIHELDQMIRRTPPGFQLASHLDGLANKNGVKMESIKERPGTPNNLYRESQVEVTVRQITIRVLIQFLYEIENSGQVLRISSLKVRPNFQDPTQLSATFVVSTFQANEGS